MAYEYEMDTEVAPVTSMEEVMTNVRRFNKDLEEDEDLPSQLSQFRHWYYLPGLDAFGPSKFIGYKEMTARRYDRGRNKDGRETEDVLRRWFVKLSSDSDEARMLLDKLTDLLMPYGKKPNKATAIHVPRGRI